MRLEKKREEELARRKGSSVRAVISFVWLIISIIVAYFLVQIIFDNGILTYGLITQILFFIPRRILTPLVAQLLVLLVMVMVMQIVLYIGFIVGSYEGRRRVGRGSLHSRNKDPFDNPYR